MQVLCMCDAVFNGEGRARWSVVMTGTGIVSVMETGDCPEFISRMHDLRLARLCAAYAAVQMAAAGTPATNVVIEVPAGRKYTCAEGREVARALRQEIMEFASREDIAVVIVTPRPRLEGRERDSHRSYATDSADYQDAPVAA